MGANNSKNGGEVLPARIRQRMEELRNCKNGAPVEKGEEGALLKKKLLNDGDKSQSSEENENEDKKGSSNDTQSTKRVEKLPKVVPLSVSEPGTKEKRHELHNKENGKDVEKKGEVVGLKTVKVKSANHGYNNNDNNNNNKDDQDEDNDKNEDNDENDENDDDEYGRFIGLGSPSFKIYCNETENKNEEEGDENQTVVVLQKPPSLDSSASASWNSGNSEVVEIKSAPKTKRNKKKKFGAMKKNLLHVKHLNMNRMNPILACTRNDRRRLLQGN